jgi:hypothetical protein
MKMVRAAYGIGMVGMDVICRMFLLVCWYVMMLVCKMLQCYNGGMPLEKCCKQRNLAYAPFLLEVSFIYRKKN